LSFVIVDLFPSKVSFPPSERKRVAEAKSFSEKPFSGKIFSSKHDVSACLHNFFSHSISSCHFQESPSPDTPSSQDAVAMKKALEWELALDSRDLRSHAWYHGPVPRQRADEILKTEGDFLVRDCVSQPGNYVLSCKTKTQTLHFVINKVSF
jgi:SH2 domain